MTFWGDFLVMMLSNSVELFRRAEVEAASEGDTIAGFMSLPIPNLQKDNFRRTLHDFEDVAQAFFITGRQPDAIPTHTGGPTRANTDEFLHSIIRTRCGEVFTTTICRVSDDDGIEPSFIMHEGSYLDEPPSLSAHMARRCCIGAAFGWQIYLTNPYTSDVHQST